MRIERRRAKAEDELRESHEKYRTLVESSTEGTLMVLDGRPAFANPTMLDLLDVTEDELGLLDLVRGPAGKGERVARRPRRSRPGEAVVRRRDGQPRRRRPLGHPDLVRRPAGLRAGRPAPDVGAARPRGPRRRQGPGQGESHRRAPGVADVPPRAGRSPGRPAGLLRRPRLRLPGRGPDDGPGRERRRGHGRRRAGRPGDRPRHPGPPGGRRSRRRIALSTRS